MRGDVTDAGQTNERTNERTLKIELLSQWKLEAESRNVYYIITSEDPHIFGNSGNLGNY